MMFNQIYIAKNENKKIYKIKLAHQVGQPPKTLHLQTTPLPGALSKTNRFLMCPRCAVGYDLPSFLPSTDVTVRRPRCGARHEALNEGFLSGVGGFTQWGVKLDTGG